MLALIHRIFISSILSLVLVSCGGGTTGTSPTVVKLSGTAQDQNGAGISNTSMTVSSAPSGEVLIASSTDSAGRFEMTLPSSETELDISVEGATPLIVERSISDSSAAFTSLKVDRASQSSLASQVEARIVGSSCRGITFTPLSVDATGVQGTPKGCEVDLEVATGQVNAAPSVVVTSGRCGSGTKRRDLTLANTSGHQALSIDIAPALSSTCEDLLIEVRANGAPAQAIQFEVTR
jgi:hypothetical protein